MGTLCLTLLKFFDGLKPTVLDGEFGSSKNSYFFSKSNISLFISSYSASEIFGELSL